MITIRPFQDSDMSGVLELSSRSESTSRSIDTWRGNNMTAMLALDGNDIIGAIPLEKRSFCVGYSRYIDILWVSGAHVDPEYRDKGIGSAMDRKISDTFSGNFKGVFVYRGDETSKAYRWYRKLGYDVLLPIVALKKDLVSVNSSSRYTIFKEDELTKIEAECFKLFKRYVGDDGGFSKRYDGFWSAKPKTHYYKEFYSYSILALMNQSALEAYAFLGQTDMKDGVKRFDILEMAYSDDESRKKLFDAIYDFGNKQGVAEVRIQLSFQDPDLSWLTSLGFQIRWRTNIMGKLFDPMKCVADLLSDKVKRWRYFQIDYI